MKPVGARYRATTQVKGLSPEIPVIPVADAFHLAAGNTLTVGKRDCERLAGSETVARYQRDRLGTRESHNVPNRVWVTRSEKDKAVQMALWQSDKPIVVMKSCNGDGAKGFTGTQETLRDTSPRLRAVVKTSTKLKSLTQRARENPHYKFTTLAYLLNEGFLEECFKELKRDKAPGIDGVTLDEYEADLEENIKDLVGRLKAKHYRPQPVRRVYIPKPNGERRPIGIPAIEDKIVQMGIKKILEAIFEANFLDVSYGFRPGRSCHDALDEVDRVIMTKPVNYIVDVDIERFFDSVNHEWLRECLKQRIRDYSFQRLIDHFLKAGVVEGGKYIETDEGTPQGGVLSPLLANIYLHYILDLWFEKEVKKQLKGYAHLVRYADDFIVCFQSRKEASDFYNMLKERLESFGLKVAEDKSRIIEFGRYAREKAQRQGKKVATFEFLGFTHYCDKTRKGKFKLGRKTAKSRLKRKLKRMNEWLRSIRNRVKLQEWWRVLILKLIGYYRYYGISGNIQGLKKFYYQTLRLAYKWINRRSQKRSCNWEQFRMFIRDNPLPGPKIYRYYPVLVWGSVLEEPCAGKLHARFCEGH